MTYKKVRQMSSGVNSSRQVRQRGHSTGGSSTRKRKLKRSYSELSDGSRRKHRSYRYFEEDGSFSSGSETDSEPEVVVVDKRKSVMGWNGTEFDAEEVARDHAGFQKLGWGFVCAGFIFVTMGMDLAYLLLFAIGLMTGYHQANQISYSMYRLDMLIRESFRSPNGKKHSRARNLSIPTMGFVVRMIDRIVMGYMYGENRSKPENLFDAEDMLKVKVFREIMALGDVPSLEDVEAGVQLKEESRKVYERVKRECETTNSVGATPFLFAVLVGKKDLIAFILSDKHLLKRVIAQSYSKGSVYEGENALHIAIAQRNLDLAKEFVKKARKFGVRKKLVQGEATGTFFSQLKHHSGTHEEAKDIHMCRTSKQLRIGRSMNHLYYGAFPLSFAVATNQEEMFRYLLHEAGADERSTDRYGNTILHIAVVHNLENMIPIIINEVKVKYERLDKKRGPRKDRTLELFVDTQNEEKLSALVLAAKLGHKEALQKLIEHKQLQYWGYASITAYLFPLKELVCRNGILDQIVTHQHTDLVKLPLISTIMVKQWSAGFNRLFREKLYAWVIYLILLLFSSLVGSNEAEDITPIQKLLVASADVALCIFAGSKLWTELGELRKDGVYEYVSGSPTEQIENICSFVSCSTSILGLASRYIGFLLYMVPVTMARKIMGLMMDSFATNSSNGDLRLTGVMFAWSQLTGWLYMLFFLLGYQKSGIFIATIIKLIKDDVKVFVMVMAVLVLAFGTFCFHILGDSSFLEKLGDSFQTILGDYDISNYNNSIITSIVSVIYALFISVTLMNSLIAKMSSDFEELSKDQGLFWFLERGRIMLSISREYGGLEKLIYFARQHHFQQRRRKSKRDGFLFNNNNRYNKNVVLEKFWIDKLEENQLNKLDENDPDTYLDQTFFEYHVENEKYYTDPSKKKDTKSDESSDEEDGTPTDSDEE